MTAGPFIVLLYRIGLFIPEHDVIMTSALKDSAKDGKHEEKKNLVFDIIYLLPMYLGTDTDIYRIYDIPCEHQTAA